jgi:hypothetical protein
MTREGGTGQPTKVIYVMGAGRSGSSILGVALGNCDGVFYAGELDKWLPRRGVSPLEGEERARFWSAVREQVDAEDLYGYAPVLIERSSMLARPRALRARLTLGRRYRAVAAELFAAVARVAGAGWVLDSSHYPLRARELQRAEGIELHLLFLLREPQAVVASLARKDVPERSYGTLAANAYLWLTYLICTWVFLRQPRARRLLVRHEGFLADPAGTLAAILAAVGAGGEPPELGALRTGPVFQANRLVRREVVALKPEGAPAARARSRTTAVVQWPLQRMLARLQPVARAPASSGTLEPSAHT